MSKKEKRGSAGMENPEQTVFIPKSGDFMPGCDRKDTVQSLTHNVEN